MGIKYRVNEEFFEKWNKQMAYVLGYLYADGNIEDCSYIRAMYVKVTSIDRSTICKIKKWMNSEHKIVRRAPSFPNGHDSYLLRIGSHKLYSDLIKLGLYPNKSLSVKFPNVPTKFLGDFIRGYFDGDGCVYIERSSDKKLIKRLRTIFTSGSYDFLEKMNEILRTKISLIQNKVYKSHRSYQLRYSTDDSLKLFKLMYNNCEKNDFLERKFTLFKNYFNIRQNRLDSKISKIID